MKKSNLIIGIVGGAVAGAAASYLMNGENRKNLVSGLQDLGEKAISPITNMFGSMEEESGNDTTHRSHNQSMNRRGRM